MIPCANSFSGTINLQSIQNLLILKSSKAIHLMSFQFQSSAIDNIVVNDDDNVTITFRGGRDYQYACSDVAGFQNDLQNVIEESESVGSFVNRAIRAQLLQQVVEPVAV